MEASGGDADVRLEGQEQVIGGAVEQLWNGGTCNHTVVLKTACYRAVILYICSERYAVLRLKSTCLSCMLTIRQLLSLVNP